MKKIEQFLLEHLRQSVKVMGQREMKNFVQLLSTLVVISLLASCGKSGSTSAEPQMPDPVTHPEANASVFQRTCDGVNGLIDRKDYKTASEAMEAFKKFKLTPEQGKIVEQMRAKIPKSN